ncbi:MAG: phospholipid transport system substrate-binding protein [Thermodesulfobacteriota bacterium]|nr:phospholipid transport system substrate-binding protein [Thermodesulfobacteriota bacterium]
MRCDRSIIVAVALLMALAVSSVSVAGEPTEDIRKTTDRIIAIVTDPGLKEADKAREKSRQIRSVVDERFNWEEMSKRTLARHWKDRTQNEKEEFIDLFGKLLERTYLDKVEGYSGEKVLYVDEKVQENYAIVGVRIVTKQETEIQVDYRLQKKGEEWLVYDISIEGVSLINNYRKQFDSIMTRSSYTGLIEKLRSKVVGEN